MTEGSNNRTLVTIMTNKNQIEDIYFEECHHCAEKIPVVGTCATCGTDYVHLHTIENYDTGFLHFVYACSDCPEDQQKAQKIIKIHEVSSTETEPRNKAMEMTRNFLY